MNVQDCKVGDVLVLEKDHHIRFVRVLMKNKFSVRLTKLHNKTKKIRWPYPYVMVSEVKPGYDYGETFLKKSLRDYEVYNPEKTYEDVEI